MRGELKEELGAAIGAERAAWLAVKDRLPGTPSHDAELWQAWRAAVVRCSLARKALDEAAAASKSADDAGTQAS